MDGAFRAAVHRDAVQCRLGPDGPPSHTHSKEKTRQMTSVRRMLTGFLLAIAAGFGWGSMGVAAQVMMTDGGFTAQDLVALRVFGAGVLLTLMTLLTERGRVSKLFSDMVLLRDVVIYGLGVLATQFTFFLAIRDAGAATAAIMVITGPLFVIGWIAATTRKPVSILELAAFCLAATGVVRSPESVGSSQRRLIFVSIQAACTKRSSTPSESKVFIQTGSVRIQASQTSRSAPSCLTVSSNWRLCDSLCERSHFGPPSSSLRTGSGIV